MFDDAVGVALGAGARIRRNNQAAQAIIDEVHAEKMAALAEVERLKQALAKASGALQLEQAYAAGLLAEVKALLAAHPETPLLRKTGGRNKVNREETALTQVFNKGFDEALRAKGVANPEKYRD